jgi:hypothetical protein
MSNNNTNSLPTFKDQCNSRSIIGQDPPATRLVASARRTTAHSPTVTGASVNEGLAYNNSMRSLPWPEDADKPRMDALHPIVPLTEAVALRDSHLHDEELQRQVPSPPRAMAAAVGQRHEYVLTCVLPRKNIVIWLVVIAVLAAVAVVGGLCGTGKCGKQPAEATSASPDSPTVGRPNSTETPPPLDPSTTTKSPTTLVPIEIPTATPTGGPTPKPTFANAAAAPITRVPTVSPSAVPAVSSNRSAAIAAYINNITLTNKTIAYPPPSNGTNSITAEEQALQWLIESDPLNLTASSDKFRLQQRYALAALWFETTSNGDAWNDTKGWLTAEKECNWIGITCNNVVGFVVERIDLPNNNITGGIPVDLGLLQNLNWFDLSQNALSGSLPESIGQWTALDTFRTFSNSMNGTLPASFGQWTAIRDVNMYQNSYTGSLPDSIGNWSKLEYFFVSENTFTGTIPKSTENWKHITGASFHFNNFTGSMPAGICNAANLSADCSEVTCTKKTCCTTCY